MCSRIFSVFINLTHLMFSESSYEDIVWLLFDFPSRSFSCSSLLVLNIKVQSFPQFLCLLDGRFNQLHTLIVDMNNPVCSIELVQQNKVSFKRKEIFIFFVFIRKNCKSEVFCSIMCLGIIRLS